MDIRKEITAAIEAGDDNALRSLLQQLEENGQLSGYLKGLMLFGALEEHVPEAVNIMPFIHPDHPISGGPILANVAYHTGLVGDIDAQRTAISFLLMHGADPNVSFVSTEHMEDARPLSVFNMLITSQIGKPDKGFPLIALFESLMMAGLDINGDENEPSKLEQVVTALHPFNLLQTKFSQTVPSTAGNARLNELLEKTDPTHEEMDEIDAAMADFMNDELLNPYDRPPFDGRQLYNAQEIIEELVRAGASLGGTIEHAPDHHFNRGMPFIKALEGYKMIIDTAMQDPQAFKERLEKECADGWETPEFDLSIENLRAAASFYDRLFHHVKEEIYLPASVNMERGGGRSAGDW